MSDFDWVKPQHGGLKDYISNKIEMLTDEFMIPLTKFEKEHFYKLSTESEVDQYAHRIIHDRL